MEKIVEQALLFDFYGELLTEHQKQIYEDHVLNDLSVSEIAADRGISRQGVHEAVKTASNQLLRYEDMLGIARRYTGIRREVAVCREALQGIRTEDTASLAEAHAALDRIDRIER